VALGSAAPLEIGERELPAMCRGDDLTTGMTAPGARAVGSNVCRTLGAVGLVLTALALLVVVPAAGMARAAPAACGPSIRDALTETPWPLRRLRPELAWPLTRGSGIVVAVIDSGVSTTHPSLEGQVLRGHDFVQPGGVGDCDEVAHGTFVAGIIAGKQLANSGFYGVAPGAKILPIRVMRDDQKSVDAGLPLTIAAAIDLAVQKGAQVINLSLVTQLTPQLTAAVEKAVAQDVIVVAAAGNEGASQGRGQPAYPAALDGVIAVAGIDEDEKRVSTSTTGRYVDVAAPGFRIDGPAPQGGGFGRREGGGTSFAAAYVSGVAALVRRYHPGLTAEQVAGRIRQTADHPPEVSNSEVGFGTVNPYRAVTAVLDGPARAQSSAPPAVALPAVPPDQSRATRAAAIWTAVGGLAVAVLVLLSGVLLRRGRARGWRPGRDARPPALARRVTTPTRVDPAVERLR